MNNYIISTEKKLLDVKIIFALLKDCFWSKDIPIEYIKRFIEYSLCFGIYYDDNKLIGFGRVISDYTTYAYVTDVVIDKAHRRKGLANQLINAMLLHPDLQGLKTWSLRTTDEARKIYKANNFQPAEASDTIFEINNLAIYTAPDFVNIHKS